jgi:hypothetical protein
VESVDTNCGIKDSIGGNLLGVYVVWVNLRISVLGWCNISYSHNSLWRRRSRKCAHCRSSSALCLTWKARDTRVHLPLLSSDRHTEVSIHVGLLMAQFPPSPDVASPPPFSAFSRAIRVTKTLVFDICRQPMIQGWRCSLMFPPNSPRRLVIRIDSRIYKRCSTHSLTSIIRDSVASEALVTGREAFLRDSKP